MVSFAALGLQVVLVVPTAGEAVRFGVPVRAAAVADGLRLRGPGRMQWRRLPVGGAAPDPVWIEVAIAGVNGTARVVAGGGGPVGAAGPAFARERRERRTEHGRQVVTSWRWAHGVTDVCTRLELDAPARLDGEDYAAGEARTRWTPGAEARAAVVCELPRRCWELAAVLPRSGRARSGATRRLRRELLALERRLVELPGERGAGDFQRSGGVVTNNEFDTALGLLRLALATGDRDALLRGLRCARHLCDRDLDARTGLPFPHGAGHRTGVPVPGHVWLQGLLLAGLLTADDDLVAAARSIGRALAARPPLGGGRFERARDFAWPLLELEGLLAVDPDPAVAAAADRLARAVDARFDPRTRTFRFGEGEVAERVYLERAWITGGLVLPALRRHLLRRPDAGIAEHVGIVERALLDRIDTARAGLPTHWRCTDGGEVFAEHRVERDVRALLMLEGLAPAELRRLLGREELRGCLTEVLLADDPDLPTAFSMVARCGWVYR